MTCNGALRRLAAFAAVLAALAAAGDAHANRARRAALAGNLGLVDDTDLYLFPGEIAYWATRFDLDVAPRVTGAMLFGEPISPVAFGVALNRDQTLNNLDGVDDLALFGRIHAGTIPPLPATEVGTLLLGLQSGLGLRLSLTHGAEGVTFDTADGEQENSTSVTGVEGSLGWSRISEDGVLDTFLTVRLNAITEEQGEIKPFESSAPSFSAGGRGIFPANDFLSWVALANVSLRSYAGEFRVQPPGAEDAETLETDARAFLVRAGFGPRLEVGNWITVASIASVGFGSVSIDREEELEYDSLSTAIAIPGFDTAVELHPSRYVDLRWGFRSRYLIEDETFEDESEETENDERGAFRSTGEFSWAAGVGLNYWDFDWDVEFSQLLGNADASQLIVSLSYAPRPETFRKPPAPLPRPASPYDADYFDDDEGRTPAAAPAAGPAAPAAMPAPAAKGDWAPAPPVGGEAAK